ncbi:MAG: hypothetical protein HY913_13150 [Desulfomonile tiedjei]|nr:hypothetical protein [Desulfomonile tiedjei]
MSIRFHCDCGASFEVPDDQAGLAGRCLGCGTQLTIPEKSQIPVDITPASADAPPVDEAAAPRTTSVRGLYCPFCGAFTGHEAITCPGCRKTVNQELHPPSQKIPFTPLDWLLVTLLAPSGLLTGFILLLVGKRKGLDMVGIAAASMLIWWFVFIIMGWIG